MLDRYQACEKTQTEIQKAEDKRLENAKDFCNTECTKNINEAIKNKQFETVIKVPQHLKVSDVIYCLRCCNYTVGLKYIFFGRTLSISWYDKD